MKIYRWRWWHDEDLVETVVAVGAMIVVTAVLVGLAWQGKPDSREPEPTQVLPAPLEMPGERSLMVEPTEASV